MVIQVIAFIYIYTQYIQTSKQIMNCCPIYIPVESKRKNSFLLCFIMNKSIRNITRFDFLFSRFLHQ
jgi:hypothetical protein